MGIGHWAPDRSPEQERVPKQIGLTNNFVNIVFWISSYYQFSRIPASRAPFSFIFPIKKKKKILQRRYHSCLDIWREESKKTRGITIWGKKTTIVKWGENSWGFLWLLAVKKLEWIRKNPIQIGIFGRSNSDTRRSAPCCSLKLEQRFTKRSICESDLEDWILGTFT